MSNQCDGVNSPCRPFLDLTPVDREQRPGLSSLRYRVGTYALFLEEMKRDIGATLHGLSSSEPSDPSLALLDAGAAMLDVLAFYQERIANEGFLRTATERKSVLELSRSIGYELNPGVAASAYLVFTVEDAQDPTHCALVPKGTKVQSVPGPGEKAQIFETIEEEQEVCAPWNEFRVKGTQKATIQKTSVFLKGSDLHLQKGDVIVVVGDERLKDPLSQRWDQRTLTAVIPSMENGWTLIEWDEPLGDVYAKGREVQPSQDQPAVHVFRQRASLFGHNAPDARLFKQNDYSDVIQNNKWIGFALPRPSTAADGDWSSIRHPRRLDLSAAYPKILKNGWLLLTRPFHPGQEESNPGDTSKFQHTTKTFKTENCPSFFQLYRITDVSLRSRSDFSISSEITRIIVDKKQDLNQFGLRETIAWTQSEKLELADIPRTAAVTGATFELSSVPHGLDKGKKLLAWGKLEGSEDMVGEVVTVDSVNVDSVNGVFLIVKPPLKYSYQATTFRLSANVIKATHGETKDEVLGSGDGSRIFQKFTLKQVPITYVPLATSSGGTSTLEVRVNQVLWQETLSLLGQGGNAPVYTVRLDDDGRVTVQFGDGITGARLPTGIDNVTARYRIGTGVEGMVRANQLSLLMTRPLGVKSVSNPLPAVGANDRELRDAGRVNAPFTVMTLGRVVSLYDYEMFARNFSGIGKAKAVWLQDRRKRFVHLTVMGAGGQKVQEGSELFGNLQDALLKYGLPSQKFLIQSSTPVAFSLRANVLVKKEFIAMEVLVAATRILQTKYGFAARSFGESVMQSEVIALIQQVPGVEMVDLDFLQQGETLGKELAAHSAYWDAVHDQIHPAQLLVLFPNGVELINLNKGHRA